MIDAAVARALLDRDPPVDLPDGTTYLIRYVHKHAHEDAPVLAYTTAAAVREVATTAGVPWALVSVVDVSPAELEAAWARHNPMDPPPLVNCHALVAYAVPRDADGIPTGPHTATCGCRLFGRSLFGPCAVHAGTVAALLPAGGMSLGPFSLGTRRDDADAYRFPDALRDALRRDTARDAGDVP